jgi:hypothetical protein
MNEIELNVEGKIYRLTNKNNGNKYDRAVQNSGQNTTPKQILAHYDKLRGYIQDSEGKAVPNDLFWEEEKNRLKIEQARKARWRLIGNFTNHQLIAGILVTVFALILSFLF